MPTPTTAQVPAAVARGTVWLLARAHLAGKDLVADALAPLGLGRRHHLVLAALDEFGPAAQAPLCRRIGLDGSDMVAVMNDLEARDLVVRERDPQDRRRNSATVTPAGRRTLGRLDRAVTAAEDRLLAALTPAERDRLRHLLGKVVASTGDGGPPSS